MPWGVKVLLMLFGVGLIAVVGTKIQRLFPRRTIGNWAGEGVDTDLRPEEAALLLGRHPGIVFAIVLHSLRGAGHLAVLSLDPLAIEWSAGRPHGRVEEALATAVGPEGADRADGALSLIEAVYDSTDEKMQPYSGRRTALYYRQLVDRFWEEAILRGLWAPDAFGWLLMRDPRRVWANIGDSPDEERLKKWYRALGHFEQHLFPVGVRREAKRSKRHPCWAYSVIPYVAGKPTPEEIAWRGRIGR